MKGIFGLATAADLLRKMRHDFERLDIAPDDSFAAFDFFVAARHLPEWMTPDERERFNASAPAVQLRDVVRDIGDTAKHWEVTRPRVTYAKSTMKIRSDYSMSLMGIGRYSAGYLSIHLSDDASRSLGQAVIDARGLARRVLDAYGPLVDNTPPNPGRSRFNKGAI